MDAVWNAEQVLRETALVNVRILAANSQSVAVPSDAVLSVHPSSLARVGGRPTYDDRSNTVKETSIQSGDVGMDAS